MKAHDTFRTKASQQQGPCPFLLKRTHHQHAADEDSALPNGHALCNLLLQQESLSDKFSYAKALSVCSKEKGLDKGRSLHALAVSVGLDLDAVVATAVLNAYGKCGILEDAHETFDRLPKKDVISWNAIIASCAQHRLGAECLRLSSDMHQKCILPDKFTCVSMLSACATLENIRTGLQVHAWWLCIRGPRGEIIVDTALINMYGKCSRVDYARGVFNEMAYHDIISWNAMISGYAQKGYAEDAFCLFNKMLGHGVIPNKITIIGILDACAALFEVQEVHAYLVEIGLEVDAILGSAFVNMYCKFSSLHDSIKIFDGLTERNLITWNSMIAGYTTHQHIDEALKLFRTMQDEGISPDGTTWSSLLDACAGLDSPAQGECIYNCIVRVGLEYDSSVAASAIKLYGKVGYFDISRTLFQKIPQKSLSLWTALIMVYAQHGLITTACELFHDMHESGVICNSQIYVDLLGACGKHAILSAGRWFHVSAVLLAMDTDVSVLDALINMYGKCGSLEDAWFLFDKMPEKNVVVWTTMISTYAQFGNNAFAIHLYSEMQGEIVFYDKVTFIDLLKACSRHGFLSVGRSMHNNITIRGFDLDVIVGNALTDMYGKCGVLDDAKSLFSNMAIRDVVSWNTMITAYAQHAKVMEALECLTQMREREIPNEVTFVSILSACTIAECITEIRLLHQSIVLEDFESNPSVASSLINVYGKWGLLEDAQHLFNRLLAQNVAAWKAMIMGYIEQGKLKEAVQVFVQMQMEGILADKASYICYSKAFSSSTSLVNGRQLHACIISLGFSQDIVVNTALVSMYGKCYSLEDACILFDEMLEKDEVSWAAMHGALLESESFARIFKFFGRMLEEAVLPNSATLLMILHACTKCRAFTDGCRLHARLVCGLFLSDSKIRNAILNLYGECGNIAALERFFYHLPIRDVSSYNVMIKNYVRAHHPQEALQMFYRLGVEGLIPDLITSVSWLEACGSMSAYFQGKSLHTCMLNSGFVLVMVNNALINMYSKCGHLQEAIEVFTHMPERNVASWNTIISASCQWECGKQALQMFNIMISEVFPDTVTFATVLCACASEDALIDGKILHMFIASLGLEKEVVVGNSLISMYGKCGGLQEAEAVFEKLLGKNTATWNTMIVVDTLQGDTNESVYLLEKMQRSGVIPNEITIASVLNCCASNGAEVAGRLTHMYIILHGLELDVSLVTSLVNLYGKCGILKDALSVFNSAASKNSFTWTAMIVAYTCLGLGEEALALLMRMQHKGLLVDRVALLSICAACNFTGLLDTGQYILSKLSYRSTADIQHLDSVIDLLGRMGQLEESEALIATMPFQPTLITWMALLGACRNMGDVGRASHAAAHILEMDGQNTAACIMLCSAHLAAQPICTVI